MKLGTVKKCNIKYLDLPVFPCLSAINSYSFNNDLYFGGKVKASIICFNTWITIRSGKLNLLVQIPHSTDYIHYVKDSEYGRILKIETRKFKKMCKSIKGNFDNNKLDIFSYYVLSNKKQNEASIDLIDEIIDKIDKENVFDVGLNG
jgi:hypothetical protein